MLARDPLQKPQRWWRIAAAVAAVAVVILVARAVMTRRPSAGSLAGLFAAAVGTLQAGDERGRKPNRLAREKSPYLLQHAMNPVDWYPWGDEAFDKARRENKPIFLSIGYSTCHWCHVMERESFENDSVAALLNQWFVSIKVDREERPDVDRIYMTAMQAMGMGGGWPLNVFLTPDLEPFFGGTYFPPGSMSGRPGMLQILPRVHEAWTNEREQVVRTGNQVIEALAGLHAPDTTGTIEIEPLLQRAAQDLARSFDQEGGGFGQQPKFPSTVNLNFLLRYWYRDPGGRGAARDMALRQLDAMASGGIHDHLGGGFHRYSTDRRWQVPHFEKMLYDQAQLAWAYLEAYQVRREPRDAETARGIFAYVARDLTAPEGAFYSAEDADSEGEEGRFYVWTPAQIEAALGAADARRFAARYGVTPGGNFEHGTSILHEVGDLEAAGEAAGTAAAATAQLAAARARLLDVRSRRVRPHRDDKVLTAWNGLMISACARGARVLYDPALARRGTRAAEFVWSRLYDERSGELRRRWRDGHAGGAGQLDDYAYLTLGLVDLYGATFDPRWLERAVTLTEAMCSRFWDEREGGFYESPAGDASIKVRMKDGYDGAEMAGNSIAAYDLQLLGTLLDRRDWLEKARRTFEYYARRLASQPAAMPQMLVAMDLSRATPRHVVIAGRPEAADTRALVAAFDRHFLPHDLLLVVDGGAAQKALARLAPFVTPLVAQGGRATAYVCENYACQLPTTDLGSFVARLEARDSAPESH